MILDMFAYFLIAVAVAIAIVVLLLFIILVVVSVRSEWKEIWPLLAFALLLAGCVWALIRLGVM